RWYRAGHGYGQLFPEETQTAGHLSQRQFERHNHLSRSRHRAIWIPPDALDERELKVAIEMAVFRHQMEMEREALIHQLQTALAQVKALSGLLPICAECKKVRDDGGYWSQVEAYIEQRTEARYSHGLCPICFDTAMARHR